MKTYCYRMQLLSITPFSALLAVSLPPPHVSLPLSFSVPSCFSLLLSLPPPSLLPRSFSLSLFSRWLLFPRTSSSLYLSNPLSHPFLCLIYQFLLSSSPLSSSPSLPFFPLSSSSLSPLSAKGTNRYVSSALQSHSPAGSSLGGAGVCWFITGSPWFITEVSQDRDSSGKA